MIGKIFVFVFSLSCMNPTFTLRLLFSNDQDIRLFWTNRKGSNERFLVSELESAVGVDFHFQDQIIFWTDASEQKIFACSLKKGSEAKSIVSRGLIRPEGLAVDWITRKLYWTDSDLKLIEVANFDGSHRKTLVWKKIDNPRAIAVDPIVGYMFWSDWGETPKISRAGMDGSNKTDLITTLITWPNGLTLDYKVKRLYWLDARHKYIASIDYYGNDRQVTYNGALDHPYALTILNNQLFWTDWDSDSIRSCHILERNITRVSFVVKSNIYSPMDLKVFEPERQPNVSSNPCSDHNGGCSHLCLLVPGDRYSCSCPTGVSLLQDNKTCEDGPQQFLLLTRSIEIRLLSLSTQEYRDLVLPIGNLGHVVALEFDSIDNNVYWIDSQFQEIKRAHLNGSGALVVVRTDLHTPEGLAVDQIGRKLYWTDAGTDRIEVCHLNGSSRRVLVSENLDEPRAIVVDSEEGFIYWSDWGVDPKLERIKLDGTKRQVLINTSIQWPNGLVLDHVARKLYWGDARLDKIEVCDLTGANRSIITSSGISHIFGFALVGDYLYWTDSQRNILERIHKNNTTDREILLNVVSNTMALKGVDLLLNSVSSNPCSDHNGGCSHLCLLVPGDRYSCSCPTGVSLLQDNKTCEDGPQQFLLLTRSIEIRLLSLSTQEYRDLVLPIGNLGHVVALEFDSIDNNVYWIDSQFQEIKRAHLNGSGALVVVRTDLHTPEGLAVDQIGRKLYWTDAGTDRIEVCHLNGSSRRVLVSENLDEPRAIVVDSEEGFIYWSDWGVDPKLERIKLDGTKRKVLINTSIQWPNGLVLDHVARKLYWGDARLDKIEVCDLTGANRAIITSSGISHIFGFALVGDYLYWTDSQRNILERIHKNNTTDREILLNVVSNTMALKGVDLLLNSGM